MYCRNCGTRLSPASRYCPRCGTPVSEPEPEMTEGVPAPEGGGAAKTPDTPERRTPDAPERRASDAPERRAPDASGRRPPPREAQRRAPQRSAQPGAHARRGPGRARKVSTAVILAVLAAAVVLLLVLALALRGGGGGAPTPGGTGAPAEGSAAPEASAGPSESPEPDESAAPEGGTAPFNELEGSFVFTDRVGGWETVLEIAPDGSFTGRYTAVSRGNPRPQFDLPEPPDGYTYTVLAEFTGRFRAERLGAQEYRLYIEEMEYAGRTGGSRLSEEDETLYVYDTARGIHGTESLYLYLPGYDASQLSEPCRSWIARALDVESLPAALDTPCLRNPHTEEAFARI